MAFYYFIRMNINVYFMMNDPRLERYLELCQRMYERMERDGTWPWQSDIPESDSTVSENLIDSDSHQNEV